MAIGRLSSRAILAVGRLLLFSRFGTGKARSRRSRGFDRLIDAANRVPRPLLAFGAIGFFLYGLVLPEEFSRRMAAFGTVPEPLWWLISGVVGFHFGAREAHHFREKFVGADGETNPAIGEWRSVQATKNDGRAD